MRTSQDDDKKKKREYESGAQKRKKKAEKRKEKSSEKWTWFLSVAQPIPCIFPEEGTQKGREGSLYSCLGAFIPAHLSHILSRQQLQGKLKVEAVFHCMLTNSFVISLTTRARSPCSYGMESV
uniref:Uncharacterized protein n=1 Tax=Myotis myotis TaxID=51298 RepID=A0A7J8ANB5_MYOMY|nr:hypothetical protein mMyoMyo1_008165 [Myotis myotis]